MQRKLWIWHIGRESAAQYGSAPEAYYRTKDNRAPDSTSSTIRNNPRHSDKMAMPASEAIAK